MSLKAGDRPGAINVRRVIKQRQFFEVWALEKWLTAFLLPESRQQSGQWGIQRQGMHHLHDKSNE